MANIGKRNAIVSGYCGGLCFIEGTVDRIFSVCGSHRGEYQDFVVGGIKCVSRGIELGFEEGDKIRVWFNIEGMIYKGRYIVNLIFSRFDFL